MSATREFVRAAFATVRTCSAGLLANGINGFDQRRQFCALERSPCRAEGSTGCLAVGAHPNLRHTQVGDPGRAKPAPRPRRKGRAVLALARTRPGPSRRSSLREDTLCAPVSTPFLAPQPLNAIGHPAGDRMGPRVDRIVLIGLRRSGKSTVGRLVSAAIGWTLDRHGRARPSDTGTSPADWIRSEGLDAFRDAERGAVATLAGARNAVIATGGGVPLSEENRRDPAAWCVDRLPPGRSVDPRRPHDHRPGGRAAPAARGRISERRELRFVRRARRALRSFCDLIVDGARAPDEVAARVLDASKIEKKTVPKLIRPSTV